MDRKFFSIFIALLFPFFIYAQPKLKLVPDQIEFKSNFDRLKNVYFINEGDAVLQIDSIYYRNYKYYYLRFNVDERYPIHIMPHDSIKMDCILTSYYDLPSSDTSDNMIVYSNSISSSENIKIKIDYFNDGANWGAISGSVKNDGQPVVNASVYFLRNGTRINQSVLSDKSGNFSAVVPTGYYSVAVQKDSFYTTFYGQSYTPYSSRIIKLQKDGVADVNINLKRISTPGFTIKGQVLDSLSFSPLRKSIIIARRGGHNPSKINSVNDSIPTDSYTTISDDNGTYNINNIATPDYYFIQSFSNFYVPSFFKFNNLSSAFWKQADSINVTSDLSNINIYLPRDSSIGGGTISGTITLNQGTGNNFSDVIVFAVSSQTGSIFNNAIVEDNGNFSIVDLPYGKYKIAAQKIGYGIVYTDILIIDSNNTIIDGININLGLAGITKVKNFPSSPVLYQNYPNPFNPSTNIIFFLPNGTNVALKVFDILGKEIKTLFNGFLSPGTHNFVFDAKGFSSGTYFVTLTAGNSLQVKKILLLK